MLYKDVASERGIYTVIFDDLKVSDLDDLTNDYVKASDLDARFLYENGLKDIEFTNLVQYLPILKAKFYHKWASLIKVQSNLDKNGTSNITKTVNGGNIQQNNNISAYDSEDLLTDTQTETTDNTTQTVTKSSLDGTRFIMSTYKNNYVYDIINTDIRRTLFRNVYNMERINNESYTN